jgi:hypothetical protein
MDRPAFFKAQYLYFAGNANAGFKQRRLLRIAFARVVNWTAFIVSISGADVRVDHFAGRAGSW